MQTDCEGFLYPHVDPSACIHCGLCQKACPITTAVPVNVSDQKAYAVINQDEEIRKNSSSGGVFSLIAQHILSQGGVVFGAAVTKDTRICHICVEDSSQLYQLRGSKYVQSNVGNTYSQAKQYLLSGRPVLYTGTPCQISGLKAYLGKDYDHLFCQDLICHGAPSPGVWQQYVSYREQLARSKTKSVFFRYKDPSWVNFCMRFEFENNTYYQASLREDPYLRAFLSDLCLRPSCHQCAYKTQQRQADITLADYWGIWDIHPKMHDDKGTSLVFINSEKGSQIFEAIKQQLAFHPTDISLSLSQNSAMIASAVKPKNREQFLSEIQNGNFKETVSKALPRGSIWKKLWKRAKQFAKKILRK